MPGPGGTLLKDGKLAVISGVFVGFSFGVQSSEADAERELHQFRRGRDVQFAHNLPAVEISRFNTDIKHLCDFLCGFSLGKKLQDL